MATNNITFPIYVNIDGVKTPFHDLVLRKATVDSVVMSLGDKITGDVYYENDSLVFTMQEYIEYLGVRYVLVNPPTIVREGMVSDNSDLKGMAKYSLVFYHPMYELGNMPFCDVAVTPDESKYLSESKIFNWIGKPADFVEKLNNNLVGTKWIVELGSGFPSVMLNEISEVLSFSNNFISDAIKTFYDQWEVPYIIDTVASTESSYAQGKRFKVIFGLPSQEIYDEGSATPYVFRFGQGVGLKNNSRTPKNNKIITRIAGCGSERNIPYGYPQVRWYGNQNWDYTEYEGTISYDASGHVTNQPKSTAYPLYMGIVGGEYVKLIKHPFTRKNLMPSVYYRTLFNKVSPYLQRTISPNETRPTYSAAFTSLLSQVQTHISSGASDIEVAAFTALYNALLYAVKQEVSDTYSKHIYGNGYDGSLEMSNSRLITGSLNWDNGQAGGGEFEFDDVYAAITGYTPVSLIDNTDYSPSTVLVDYYDAINDPTHTYPNQINQNAPSFETKEFEDVYPELGQNISIVSVVLINNDLTPAEGWDDTIDGDGKYLQNYFKITLPVLSFDIYACAAITEEMQINMRSGACLGCTFTVQVDWDDYKANFYDQLGNFAPTGSQRNYTKYPDSSQGQIDIILQKDNSTFGTIMPNIYQHPVSGDYFVVLGISLPQSYITSAEARLDEEMKSYMVKNNEYYFEYPLKFDEYFLENHQQILQDIKPNSIVRFNFEGNEKQLYVKQLVVKYDNSPLPKYDITLTDEIEVVINQIGKTAGDVEKLFSMYSYLRQNKDVGNDTKSIQQQIFKSLFSVYNDKKDYTDLFLLSGLPEDQSKISIKAKFGLWTDSFLSALGLNRTSGGGGATSLDDLVDVEIASTPDDGQVLKYNEQTHKWVNAQDTRGMTINDMWNALATQYPPQVQKIIDLTHIPVLSSDKIPSLDAGKITSGEFGVDRIPNLDAAKVTTGIFSVSQIPDITISKITDFPSKWAWSDIDNKPTTLSGYGITDVTIADGVITLGTGNTITPVTSVAMTVPTGFVVTGSPITKTGTLALAYSAGYEGFTTTLKNKIDLLYSLFTREGSGTSADPYIIKANYGLYTEQFLSALGLNSQQGSSGALEDLVDVNISNPQNNDVLKYNGQRWVNAEAPETYVLPTATSAALGGIKIGYTTSGKNYAVQLANGQAYVNVPWTDTTYTLPTASADTLGGVKIGTTLAIANGVINLPTTGVTAGTYKRVTVDAYGRVTSGDNTDIDTNTWRNIYVGGTSKVGTDIDTKAINFKAGSNVAIAYVAAGTGSGQSGNANYFDVVISATDTTYSAATQSVAGLMSATDKNKLDGIAEGANNYSLPLANSGTRGGVQIGYSETNSGTSTDRNYAVQLSNEKMYVNVPWANTWRGIQNNLTSDSTTDSLSAKQGKTLKGYTDTLFGYFTNGVANSAAKLATAHSLWGNSFDGTGDINGNIVMNSANGTYIQIGAIRIVYDSENNALKVVKSDGITAANFYATGGVSALGYSASGGGGGATSLDDLVNVEIASPDDGQVLKYNALTHKWVNADDEGVTSVLWSNILNKPTTIGGYGITDAYISNDTIVLGSVSITAVNANTSRTANTVLAAPNGSNGVATFRALVGDDLPTASASVKGGVKVGTGLAIAAAVLSLAVVTGVQGQNYTKVNVDEYGRVTSGSTLVDSDIPDLSATYLPRSAGSTYPLTGDLYLNDNAARFSLTANPYSWSSVLSHSGLTILKTGVGVIESTNSVTIGNDSIELYSSATVFGETTTNTTTLTPSGITIDGVSVATQGWVNSNFYTQAQSDAKYMTIAAFENLFRAMQSDGTTSVTHPYSSGVASIKALFGLWTDQYLSALGLNSQGGGGGGASALSDLTDVQITNIANGQILRYDGTHWINITPNYATTTQLANYLPLTGGTITGNNIQMNVSSSGLSWKIGNTSYGSIVFSMGNSGPVINLSSITKYNGYDIRNSSDTYFGTAGTDCIPITIGSTTKNVLTHHQSLSGYATQSWVNTQLGNYIPLSAGSGHSLTGDLYTTASIGLYDMDDEQNGYVTIGQDIDGLCIYWPSSSASHITKKLNVSGVVQGNSFKVPNGTSSQFLKADGSVDSNTYITSLSLGGLSNVSLSAVSNGQVLMYRSSDGTWINGSITFPVTSVGGYIGAVTAANIASALNNQSIGSLTIGTALGIGTAPTSGYALDADGIIRATGMYIVGDAVATQSWVGNQGYIKLSISDTLADGVIAVYDSGGAWVTSSRSNYLSGYATKAWVQNQSYLTSLSLGGLSDVQLTPPYGNGQALVYNLSTNKWENANLNFLPLSGGTLTSTTSASPLTLQGNSTANSLLAFADSAGNTIGYLGMGVGVAGNYPIYNNGSTSYKIWHSGNLKPSDYATTSQLSDYLSRRGGTITGQILRNAGGAWISGRDNAIIKTTRTSEVGNNWHPAVAVKTSVGCWTFGSVGGESLCLSYDTDTDYDNSTNSSSVINFPTAGSTGTIALTSDITTAIASYLPLSGGTLTGDIYFPADSGIVLDTDSHIHVSDSDSYLHIDGYDAMVFEVNHTERMRINSSGSVGIGTSNHQSNLDVNGTVRCIELTTSVVSISNYSISLIDAIFNIWQYDNSDPSASLDWPYLYNNHKYNGGGYNAIIENSAPLIISADVEFCDATQSSFVGKSIKAGNIYMNSNIVATQSWVMARNYATQQWVGSQDYITSSGSCASAAQLTNTRTIFGQNFNGTANVSGDITCGDIYCGVIEADSAIRTDNSFGLNQTNGNGAGISLYGGSGNVTTYGIMFATTSNFGTLGSVTGDWATYFTMDSTNSRGWIFRRGTTNVCSIGNDYGSIYTRGHVKAENGIFAVHSSGHYVSMSNNGSETVFESDNGNNIKTNIEYYASDVIFTTIDGSVYGDFVQQSDIRLKNVLDYDVLPNVEAVAFAPTIRYTWNELSRSRNRDIHLGSVAQYWQGVLPEAINTDKQGYLSMNYDVIALLSVIATAKRVVEHERRIEQLERENALLRMEINELKEAA